MKRCNSTQPKYPLLFSRNLHVQMVAAKRLLEAERPIPGAGLLIVSDVQVYLTWQGEGDGLRRIQNAAHVEEYWALPMRWRQIPQVQPRYVRLENRRIEGDAGHIAFALQSETCAFEVRYAAQHGHSAADIPRLLAVQRLSQQ